MGILIRRRGKGGGTPRPRKGRERGIVFITLVVGVGVMAVLLLRAVQPFSVVLQRDREEELIFRGEEYVEAIRAFQKDHGGAWPTELKLLGEPGGPQRRRCIRRLYLNPFDIEEGKWGLLSPGRTIFRADEKGDLVPMDPKDINPAELPAGAATGAPLGALGMPTTPGLPGQSALPGQTGLPGQPGVPGSTAMGQILPFKFGGEEGQPILGVYAPQKVKTFKEYMGKKVTNQWAFSPLVIQPKGSPRRGAPVPGQPGQPGFPGTGAPGTGQPGTGSPGTGTTTGQGPGGFQKP
jgi:hypothetical protein